MKPQSIVALLLLTSPLSSPLSAETIVVKTDSLPPVAAKRIPGLAAGSRLLSVLTAPADGDIVGVQILWGSLNGTSPPLQQTAIRVSEFAFPRIPVNTLGTVAAPILIDGGENVFSLPSPVPISAGVKFFVDLQLSAATTTGPNSPSVLMDADGYQGEDGLFSNGSWFAPFTLAINGGGDMGIRAIMRTVPEPSTYVLAAIGVVGLLVFRRHKAVAA
jgi:hypothetical protein